MSRCPDNSEWVLWAADEVSPDRRRTLELHRAACAACRRESASVARGLTALGHMDRAVEPRAEALASLRRRLADARAEKAARPSVLVFLYSHRWAAAAAAVFVLAFLVWTALPGAPVTHMIVFKSDAQVQEDLAKITVSVDMLEFAEGLAVTEFVPAHPGPAQPAAPDDMYMDEFDQLMDALQAEMDT